MEDYEAQLEYDLSWRFEELAFFKNIRAQIADQNEKKKYNRSLVLILYAHFEGFFKFSLHLYVDCINSLGLKCREVNYATAAASLADVFSDLRHPEKKAKTLPIDFQDDPSLRIFCREQLFLEELNNVNERLVKIPDNVINLESNLKPRVVKKSLFRIGLDYSAFKDLFGDIDKILEYRNNIAHGKWKIGIESSQFDGFEKTAIGVMKGMRDQIVRSIREEAYRSTA
jgi:hypothetical protein